MNISKQKAQLFFKLSVAMVLIGALFKIMHWPYSWLILSAGVCSLITFYAVKFSKKEPKTILDYSKLFLITSFSIHYIFNVFHLAYGHIFTYIIQASLIAYVILYDKDVLFSDSDEYQELESSKPIKNNLNNLFYGLAIICIIIGALFKILHWEFGYINGNLLLIVGLLIAIISLLIFTNESNS